MTIELKEVSVSHIAGLSAAVALFVILIQSFTSSMRRRWVRHLNQMAMKSAEKYFASKLGTPVADSTKPEKIKGPRARAKKKLSGEAPSTREGRS